VLDDPSLLVPLLLESLDPSEAATW